MAMDVKIESSKAKELIKVSALHGSQMIKDLRGETHPEVDHRSAATRREVAVNGAYRSSNLLGNNDMSGWQKCKTLETPWK